LVIKLEVIYKQWLRRFSKSEISIFLFSGERKLCWIQSRLCAGQSLSSFTKRWLRKHWWGGAV